MSLASAGLQSCLREQARVEKRRTKPVKQTKKSNSKEQLSIGMISQRKLSNVMEGLNKVPQLANGPPLSSPAPNCVGNMPWPNTDDPVLDEAVKAIVELNKSNLSREQLVDLLASFYYVTDRYFRQEMTRLGEATPYPAPANYKAPSQGTDHCWKPNDSKRQDQLPRSGPVASCARTVASSHVPSNSIQGGFFIGEDPRIIAAQKERQRQEWLAELDRQVQEKRALKEREKTLVMSEDTRTQAPRTPVYLRHIDPVDGGSAQCDDRVPRLHVVDSPLPPPLPVNGTQESSPSALNGTPPEEPNPAHQQLQLRNIPNKNTSTEQGFSRGRGLADLEERSNEAAMKRKQQQLELQAAYDKQIKEREARRKEERERLLREELEEAERIARERQRMEQEMRAEELRRRENQLATQEQKREKERSFQRPPSRGKVQSPGTAATEKQMSAVDSPVPKMDKRLPSEERQVAVNERPILTIDRSLPTSNRPIPNYDDEPIPTVNRRIVGVPQSDRPPSRPLDACPAFYSSVTSCAAKNPMTRNRPTNGTARKPVDIQAVPRTNANATYNAHRKGTTNCQRPSKREVSGVVTPTDFDAAARAEYRQESSRRASDRSTPLAVIRTQSNLCPPAADFLSAITNPDYAYDGVCSGLEKCQIGQKAAHSGATLRPSEGLPHRSALEQVSQIKRNLLQRQEELRSMQISASNNNRPH
uniref:CCDC66 domain-containing protein n=2 Tax=Schistocephalus solidus TaxID=70667 RepID=A0A0X3P5N9_SCHSO